MAIVRRTRLNEQIRVAEVRVIGDDGAQLGVMATEAAVALARERGRDLVEVAPDASPPVCRIMDYAKFKYEQEKKVKRARKQQHRVHLKEVKFRPQIDPHDYDVKRVQLERFLRRGDKVKVTLMFRGRELDHPEAGRRLFTRLIEDVALVGQVERQPLMEGRFMGMVFAPKDAKPGRPGVTGAAAGAASGG